MIMDFFKKPIVRFIIIISLLITVVVSVTFAWFLIKESGSVYIVTGEANSNVSMYYGNDENNDGYLDGEGEYSTRSDILANLYIELTRDPASVSTKTFEDINYGKCIVYKIVVENPASNNYSFNVDVNLSNLFDYFYLQLSDFAEATSNNESYTIQINDIQNYVARLLLCFDDISYSIFECGENDDSFNSQVGSTVSLDDANTDYFLWNFSNCEKFINDITVEAGQLVEIDFKIKYVYDSQNLSSYMGAISARDNYCFVNCINKLTALGYSNEQAQTISTSYIQAMCQEEQACLSATSDYALIELNLLIDYFEISVEQSS